MEAHLCVRNNSYLIFVRNFQKNEPERSSGLKKEPERRSGAFRSNSNPDSWHAQNSRNPGIQWLTGVIKQVWSVPGKVFATVLLNKVRDQLLAHRRTEQSGLTPGRSTIDRIIIITWTQSSKAGRSFRGLFGLLSSISRLLSTQLIVRPRGSFYIRSLGLDS